MGYFSRMATDPQEREDHSFFGPTEQLRWRIDDLRDRLLELGGCSDDAMLAQARSEDFRWPHAEREIMYVLPECLDYDDTLAALLLAENKLWRLGEPMEEELPDPDQLHIRGFYSLRLLSREQAAA